MPGASASSGDVTGRCHGAFTHARDGRATHAAGGTQGRPVLLAIALRAHTPDRAKLRHIMGVLRAPQADQQRLRARPLQDHLALYVDIWRKWRADVRVAPWAAAGTTTSQATQQASAYPCVSTFEDDTGQPYDGGGGPFEGNMEAVRLNLEGRPANPGGPRLHRPNDGAGRGKLVYCASDVDFVRRGGRLPPTRPPVQLQAPDRRTWS